MVNKENLKPVGKDRFITRLPAVYKEYGNTIRSAVEADRWNDFGTLAETPSSPKRQVLQK